MSEATRYPRRANCGHDYMALRPDGRTRKFCPRCAPAHEQLAPPRPCATCGESFQSNDERHCFCSRSCRERERHPFPPVRPCEFTGCGQEFQPKSTIQRSCSASHARKAWAERNPERDAEGKRARYHKRRALKKGAATGERVESLAIAERDNWTCHLCDNPILRDAAWPALLSLSLDHVIPLSKGGIHDPSNVKAAHLTCNTRKGDRLAA